MTEILEMPNKWLEPTEPPARLCASTITFGGEQMAELVENLSQVVRAGLEDMCCDLTARLELSGFSRTKKMLWTRLNPHVAQFVHLHRNGSSYRAAASASVKVRIHCDIRLLHGPLPVLALNGPYSEPDRVRDGRYHLRFNAKSKSMYERCLDDVVRFVSEQGEPWFRLFRDTRNLLERPDSPLTPEELAAVPGGQRREDAEAASLKLLGIKHAASP
jgi:hypothetical protein